MDGRDFLQIADKLEETSNSFQRRFKGQLKKVADAAVAIHEAWSGSNVGYQANVYYDGFRKPPAGARFSAMHGIGEDWLSDTVGDWGEFSAAQVKTAVYHLAGNPDMAECEGASAEALRDFNRSKGEVLSGLNIVLEGRKDIFLNSLLEQVLGVQIASAEQFSRAFLGGGQFMTQDTRALNGGARTAPHQLIIAEITALNQPAECGKQLSEIVRQIGSHLVRTDRKAQAPSLVGTHVVEKTGSEQRLDMGKGTKIFIGHGRSSDWRDLKDFLVDRLGLAYDEFNREPAAGISTSNRLEEMLDNAAFAFLVMTAEDENAEGQKLARMNVIHEVGLFQGRLGFRKAIILLEQGCEEFSNIVGLGQIRFEAGRLRDKSEEIRHVLERGGIVRSGTRQ